MGRDFRATTRTTALEPDGPNAIAVATGLVGDEWTLWILARALEQGLTRYTDWLAAGPISSSVLTSRLARLIEAEVFHRRGQRYHLTDRGVQLWTVLLAITAWEREWAPEISEQPAARHVDCGAVFVPLLVCAECERPTPSRDVRAVWGRSGSWQRSIPTTSTRRRARSGERPAELVTETMELLGSRWSATILGALFRGAARFGEFEEYLGAPPLVISERLRRFCELGVLAPVTTAQRRLEYQLTEKGLAFYPVVALLIDWGINWFRSVDGPPVTLTHTCGATFRPRLICDQCGRRLRGASIEAVRVARGGG